MLLEVNMRIRNHTATCKGWSVGSRLNGGIVFKNILLSLPTCSCLVKYQINKQKEGLEMLIGICDFFPHKQFSLPRGAILLPSQLPEVCNYFPQSTWTASSVRSPETFAQLAAQTLSLLQHPCRQSTGLGNSMIWRLLFSSVDSFDFFLGKKRKRSCLYISCFQCSWARDLNVNWLKWLL